MKVSGSRLRSIVTMTLLLLIAGVAFVTCDNFVLYDEIEAATASAEEEEEEQENDGTGDVEIGRASCRERVSFTV